uniref:Uncharacterized protein n=1 Tax=Anguilla anguilla TaxID=7936 RepID=A0A0E9VBF3_ANGAN
MVFFIQSIANTGISTIAQRAQPRPQLPSESKTSGLLLD